MYELDMSKLDENDYLDVSNQGLTSLDELPKGITRLYCYNNKLTSLPELPEGLEQIYCFNNNIKYLPKLPDNLYFIDCSNNPLQCIVPKILLSYNIIDWKEDHYYPFIRSYEGQKIILTREPWMLEELMLQTEIDKNIRKEFSHLIECSELNII